MRLEIVPFVPEHAARIRLRPLDALGLEGAPAAADPLETGRMYAASGPAFSGLWQGRVVASAGIVVSRPGLGDCWALTSPQTPRFALSFQRAVVLMLPRLVAEAEIERLQALVVRGHATSCRWLSRLGFRREGLLRRLYGGRDYYIYGRIETCQ